MEQTIRGTERGLKTSFILNLSQTEERLDPAYYYFRSQTVDKLSLFISLKESIRK